MRRSRVDSRVKVAELMAAAMLLPEDRDQEWRLQASCRGLDPQSFFPGTVGEADIPLRVCRNCPVDVQCFGQRGKAGIWGGTTEWERSDFARSRGRGRRPTCRAAHSAARTLA